jgi:hypothetical protein
MELDSRKLCFGLIALLILLGAGFIMSTREANALLEHKSAALVNLKAENLAAVDQQAQLDVDKSDVSKYAELNTIAESVVPQDKDQAEAVQEIVNLATESGIPKLSSIAFPPSTLGTGASSGSTKGLTQVSTVKGIPGVYDLQITVSQASGSPVSYANFITFLSKLEQNRRTAEVNSINVQPEDSNPGQIAFTLVIDEYIRP